MSPVDPRIVARLLEQLARQILDEKHLLGLDPMAWAVLRFVARVGRRKVTIASVSRYLGINEARAGQAISFLAGMGLVSVLTTENRSEQPDLVLTEAGGSALKQDPVNRLALSVSEMEPADQVQLAHLVELLQNRMYRSRASPVSDRATGTVQ